MEVFDLFKTIRMIYRFSKGSVAFAQVDPALTVGVEHDEAVWLRTWSKKVIRVCAICLVVGLLLALGTPWYAYFFKGISSSDAALRTVMGVIFSPIIAMGGVCLGACLACLFSPSRFLLSPVGERWMQLMGTRSVLANRVVSLAGALALASLLGGYSWFILAMRPTPGLW